MRLSLDQSAPQVPRLLTRGAVLCEHRLMAPTLVACSSCGTHVRSGEIECPHCGARLRREGSALRSAAAVLLGLTTAATPIAAVNCSSDVDGGGSGGQGGDAMSSSSTEVVAAYGVAPSTGTDVGGSGGNGGSGGAGGGALDAGTD